MLTFHVGEGHGHMAPCLVKDMVDGSSSQSCGTIAAGDILTSVDGVPVRGPVSSGFIAMLLVGSRRGITPHQISCNPYD